MLRINHRDTETLSHGLCLVQSVPEIVDNTPIVFLNATDDDTAPLRDARSLYDATAGAKRFYAVKASGHHFEGGEKEFYQDLDAGLSLPDSALA